MAMDRKTFDRLAEECEAAILARLRDYGARADTDGGLDAMDADDREMLAHILAGYTGPLVDEPAVAGVEGVEIPREVIAALARGWRDTDNEAAQNSLATARAYLVHNGIGVRDLPERANGGIGRFLLHGDPAVANSVVTLAGLFDFARRLRDMGGLVA